MGGRESQEGTRAMIVVVEGPSAAGKTTWIAGHRQDMAVITEDAGGAWRAAREANRRMFTAGRLGIADLILVRIPDLDVLDQRKVGDPHRTRRNFELHRQLGEPLREWYQAVSRLDQHRVRWELPEEGIGGLTEPGIRNPRTGTEVYERLLSVLPQR
jgi:hypothetical protein